MLTKTFLCSFASPDLFLSKIRFRYQAKRLKFYNHIKIFSKSDLCLKTKLTIKKKSIIMIELVMVIGSGNLK